MSKTFYITTPIYYPSGKFHIGTAYTTVLCDSLARYKKLRGYDTRYLTGMDEHGQKIQQVALDNFISPEEHVNNISSMAKELWKLLKIENDDFIRTTEQRHKTVVKEIFEQLLEQDDIYLGEYEGHYCIQCESFFTQTQLKDSELCPDCGRPTKVVKEESYFLRLGKYQDRLLKHIEENPDFIRPESRKNEVISFIKQGLNDLAVSRTSFDWGVKVVSNPKHVVYVWIDALSNYISSLGYKSNDDSLYEKYWKGDEVLHVVGKDILRFHAIYWPIMLLALKIPVNFKLFAHGWYMMKDGKMSKSKGNVIYPEPLVEKYGLDSFRYYLLKELSYGNDGIFTPEDYVSRINYDLANDLGNLVNRTISMINKYFSGNLSKYRGIVTDFDKELQKFIKETIKSYEKNIDDLKVSNTLSDIWRLVSRTNKYIDETRPWVLAKDELKKEELESVLYYLVESIRHISILLKPFLIESCEKIFSQLNIPEELQSWGSLSFGKLKSISVTKKPTPIFPRLDMNEEVEYIKGFMKEKDEVKEKDEDLISIDDFSKVSIKVGEIISSEKHPKADKLLVSKINTGDKVRQIVSGVAKHYKPEELVGKKVLVITNLLPVKLRGVLSEGMVLAGSNESDLEIIESKALNPGDIVK